MARELSELTGYKIFPNHLTTDLIRPFFGFGGIAPVVSHLAGDDRAGGRVLPALLVCDEDELMR